MVDDVIGENESLVEEKGFQAFGFLMGSIMRKHRGKVKVELVSKILKEKLSKRQEKQAVRRGQS